MVTDPAVCSITASFRFLTLRMKSFFHRILCDACPICCLIPMKVAATMDHFQLPENFPNGKQTFVNSAVSEGVNAPMSCECSRQHVESIASVFFYFFIFLKTKFHSVNTTW